MDRWASASARPVGGYSPYGCPLTGTAYSEVSAFVIASFWLRARSDPYCPVSGALRETASKMCGGPNGARTRAAALKERSPNH